MGEIKLSLREVGVTGYLKVQAREVNNPGAVVANETIPPPIPDPYGLVFTGLNEVPHYVDFYESSDGVVMGLLLMTIYYDVGSGVATSEMRFYKADGVGPYDPASGTAAITDPYLTGKNVIKVFKEGFRFLEGSVEFIQSGSTVTIPVSDALPDPTFGVGEKISLEIAYAASSSSSVAGQGYPKSVIEITSDATLNTTHYNNLMEAIGAGSILTVNIPALSMIPDGIKFGFTTDNGSQRYLAITVPPGNFFAVGKQQRGTIWLAQGEQITLIKKGYYMRVVSWTGDHLRVGDRVTKDGTPPLNSLPETGGWYLKSEYPRLWEWYINTLPPADIVNSSDDAVLNGLLRTKWAVGTTKFWVPDRKNYFDRISDGTRRAGDVQGPQVGAFDMELTKANGFSGNPSGGDVLKIAYGSANPIVRLHPVQQGKENRVQNAAVFSYRIF